jgi:hypothetical protein
MDLPGVTNADDDPQLSRPATPVVLSGAGSFAQRMKPAESKDPYSHIGRCSAGFLTASLVWQGAGNALAAEMPGQE